MYKEYMLICEVWNPLDDWGKCKMYFDTEEEMREFIETQGKGIRIEAMFKLTKIEW